MIPERPMNFLQCRVLCVLIVVAETMVRSSDSVDYEVAARFREWGAKLESVLRAIVLRLSPILADCPATAQ